LPAGAERDHMSTMNSSGKVDRNLQDDITQLREDLAQLRQDVSGLASDLFGAAREQMSGAVDGAKKRGMEVAETLEEQVTEHPLAAIGVAFGVGLLVGALVRRS
jgi:ElaB/YqjD/DUF883 family membrane-anchored ribosome-binding protein